jgi:aspartyl-tRNA(Asn)/glutamyl-tRNA(Gln) amidotransferase subunit B
MATTAETSVAAHPKYELVIGLEVHVQLLTATKIFCSCSTRFGAPPNTNVCPVCLGKPWSSPRLAAMALNCRINEKHHDPWTIHPSLARPRVACAPSEIFGAIEGN